MFYNMFDMYLHYSIPQNIYLFIDFINLEIDFNRYKKGILFL
jgi:hypothetical protein